MAPSNGSLDSKSEGIVRLKRYQSISKPISINQQAYIKSMVEKFRLTGARQVSTLVEMNAQFTKEQCPSTINQVARMKGVPYSEAIGSVLWPVVVSRPDAAYAVGILSQFIQNPGPAH